MKQGGHSRQMREGLYIFTWLKCGEYRERRQKQSQRDRKVLEEADLAGHGREFECYSESMEMALSREVTWSYLWPGRTSLLRMRVWYENRYLTIDIQFSLLSQLAFSVFSDHVFVSPVFLLYLCNLFIPTTYLLLEDVCIFSPFLKPAFQASSHSFSHLSIRNYIWVFIKSPFSQ